MVAETFRGFLRTLILESALQEAFNNRGLMNYLENLSVMASSGDLQGAVKGLVMGSHAKEARLFVFQQCQIINWREYPTLYSCGIERLIPSRMPGIWGLAKIAGSLSGWLLKNKNRPGFRQELRLVVEHSMSNQQLAA